MFCPLTKTKTLPVPVDSNAPYRKYTLAGEYSICLAKDIDAFASSWDELAPTHNIFLQSQYLRTLQHFPPQKMGFRYIILYKEEKPIGIIYAQTYFVRMSDSVNKKEIPKGLWSRFKNSIQQWFINKAVFNVLICGNLILTGEHGYYIADESLVAEESIRLVRAAIDLLQSIEEQESGKKMHIQMFKDYPIKSTKDTFASELRKANYHKYTIQPCMYMRLPKEWNSFEDYTEAMSSKYRVRARRAAKKGTELTKRELTLEEIEANNNRIYELYSNIAGNVGFNAYTFDKNYFWGLKKHLGDNFKLVGLYLGDKLVAFYTAIFSGNEMEAHFLGMDYEYNREYQIYLNILYNLIDMGIYHQVDLIDFARTALEIKSSVGAVPRELDCFVRHRNSLSNGIMKFVFDNLSPNEQWEPRSPFKDMSIVE